MQVKQRIPILHIPTRGMMAQTFITLLRARYLVVLMEELPRSQLRVRRSNQIPIILQLYVPATSASSLDFSSWSYLTKGGSA